MIAIPDDLDRRAPVEIAAWLDSISALGISPEDWTRAQKAAIRVLGSEGLDRAWRLYAELST